ncbi:ATP-binding cassette domain-containing protein [Clostridium botulinum]|nr:ATP-binding cassette domain-containing protein [Clostridium botulinum]
MSVNEGEFISIMGPSGSGKSTLLKLASTIEKPSAGSILINGIDVKKLMRKKGENLEEKIFLLYFKT